MIKTLLSFLTVASLCSAQTYQESGGLVIMESENTPSALGEWDSATSIGSFTGSAYLDFDGNDYELGPPNSPLEYTFKINRGGLYFLHLHCARERQTIDGEVRNDVANDCYVRVEGNYGAGPNAGNSHGDDAPLSMLKSDTKFFGGNHNSFVWASGNRLDPGGDTNKRVAVYDFNGGETYKLVVSGRSKAFKLDRIVFRRSDVAVNTAENLSTPESGTVTGGGTIVRPPTGRLAVVADGNSPDPDDIGATAVIFGILNGSGLNDRLVHLSHSCDLDPFQNGGNQSIDTPNELRRQNKLHALCGEGVGFFGPFPNLTDYHNCRTEQTAAVNDLRDAINASSAVDPLWIIEAGEPDIIGYALEAATPSKRQFVHVVSHHPANDNSGDFFTWAQILAFGVTEHQIGDQNAGLQVLISSGLWDWAENHSEPGIAWIWDQLEYAEQDGVVGFQNNKYDCSDAGMVYWWITGASNGGNRNSTPTEIREMLLYDPDGPVAHWALDEGSGTVAADSSGNGRTGTLLNGASWGSDATRDSYVSFDGTDDRIATLFSYALSSGDDFTWAWWANQQSTGTTDDGAIMLGNRYPQPGAGGETYEFIKLTPTHGQYSDTDNTAEIERHEYGSIAQGTWHHYAMVKDGTSYQWYVDGVAQGAPVTMNYSENTPIPFFIGGDDNGTGKVNEHFEGYIDDVVLYRRALTAAEVADVRDGKAVENDTVSGVMPGLEEDADVRDDDVIVNLGADNLVPGRSGAGGGFDRSTVLVFQLPDLGVVSNPFLSATLGFHVESTSSSPPGVDLYGLGRRVQPDVLAADYYGETPAPDPGDAERIQTDILNGSSGTGFMSTSAGGALAAYLNTQYDGGSGIGDYVFLRLTTNAPVSGLQRHFITSADAAGSDGPRISYTALAPPDFDVWLSAFDFAPGSDTSPEGDPDGDGLSTWFEYLFGLDPSSGSSTNPFTVLPSKSGGTFTYTRRNPSLTGVEDYQIWISEDLSDWYEDTTALQDTDDDGDVQNVTVFLTGLALSPTELFVRIRVP